MNPVTVASIVANATAHGLSTTKNLYDLHSKYKDAPVVIVSICSEAALVSASLTQIQSLILQRVDLGGAWAARTNLADVLDTSLTGCMILFSCLDNEVQAIVAHAPGAQPGQISWRGRVRMIWNEQKLGELLAALRGQQTAISLLIQLLQMNTLGEIKDMIQNSQPAIQASVHLARSLRSQNPSVRVPASVYDGPDAAFLPRRPLEDQASIMAPSELEFDFDDVIVSSQAYRRVLAQVKAKMAVRPHTEAELGDLIDFSDAATAMQHGNTGPSEEQLLSEALQDLRGLAIEDFPNRKQTTDSTSTAPTEPTPQAAEVDETLFVGEPEIIEASTSKESTAIIPTQTKPVGESYLHPPSRRRAKQRICLKCEGAITAQFVRAAAYPGGQTETYHVGCFDCVDCGALVSSKFFPSEVGVLCEIDYFRRMDLLCWTCGNALRGSYITALNRKYHMDHFTCEWVSCDTLFHKSDSYYEHEDACYCLVHYSSQFAQLCKSCTLPILKEFLEIEIGRPNAGHWHPDCYEIHKLCEVRIIDVMQVPLERTDSSWVLTSSPYSDIKQDELSALLEALETRIDKVRSVLSEFKEKSATFILDVILASSNHDWENLYSEGKSLIGHVSFLFESIILVAPGGTGNREGSKFCTKLLDIFSSSSDTIMGIPPKTGVAANVRMLVLALVHELMLLTSTGLEQSSYKRRPSHELRDKGGQDQLDKFIDYIAQFREKESPSDAIGTQRHLDSQNFSALDSELCATCQKSISGKCYVSTNGNSEMPTQWHVECYMCPTCSTKGAFDYSNSTARFTKLPRSCLECHRVPMNDAQLEFVPALRQYTYLLYQGLERVMLLEKTSRLIESGV